MFDNGKRHGGVMNKTYINGSMITAWLTKLIKTNPFWNYHKKTKDTDKYFKKIL